jgi:hypothetical protein
MTTRRQMSVRTRARSTRRSNSKKRRTPAQLAAFKRMLAGLKRFRRGLPKKARKRGRVYVGHPIRDPATPRKYNPGKRRKAVRRRAHDIGQVRMGHLTKAMGGASRKGHTLYIDRKPLGVIFGDKDARLVARIVSKHCNLPVQVKK